MVAIICCSVDIHLISVYVANSMFLILFSSEDNNLI